MASSRDQAHHSSFPFRNEMSTNDNVDGVSDVDSDGTLLDDEYEEQYDGPTSQAGYYHNLNIPVTDPDLQQIPTFSSNGRTLKPGKTVELRDKDFLRIKGIIQHRVTKEITLRGVRFRRNLFLDGLLEFKRNEVTMILIFESNDPRDILAQSTATVGLHEVSKIRELVKTNRPFPALSFRESDPGIKKLGKDHTTAHGRLVCRYKLLLISKNEGWVQRLRVEETDEGCGSRDDQIRRVFRGETQRGGCCSGWLNGEREFDRRERLKCNNINLLHFHKAMVSATDGVVDLTMGPYNHRRYTFGDAFCGGGGTSRGAKGAGLRVDWGFDFNSAAMDTFQRNFWGARRENIAAHDFATIITEDFMVDILHLSPPCQTFSQIHVHQGKDDEMNEATFFAVEEIVRKVKPRIVTMEETFGLTGNPEKLRWFHALIQVFTKLGFSVRWKVFNLRDFGLPQPRRRLFVTASW